MNISKKKGHTLKTSLEYVFLYAFYIILYTILINVIIAVICHFIGQEINYQNFQTVFKNINLLEKEYYFTLVIGLLSVSIIEEVVFRLPLQESNRNIRISVSIGLLWLIYSWFLPNKSLSFVLITYIICLAILYFNSNIKKKILNHLFWISVIFAGLSQIRIVIAYDSDFWPLYLMFFSLMFIKSYYLAKIRIELGIYYSFGLNILFLLVPFINHIFN